MTGKFLCAMALYDAQTEARLAGLQKLLYEKGFVGRQTKRLPMHITLGIFEPDREAEIARLLAEAARETAPFEVACSHLGVFGGAKVLFVAPDANRPLLALKERFGDSRDWTPHSTMLIDDPPALWQALPILGAAFSAFRGRVEALRLYEFAPTRHILYAPLAGREEY